MQRIFYLGAKFSIGDEKDTEFWLCAWIANKLLCALYPSLYVIAARPQIMVSEVFPEGVANVGFLRALSPVEQTSFDALLASLQLISSSSAQESVTCSMEASGKYTVKSTYAKLVCGPKVRFAKAFWATRVPPKVCIFLWQAALDHLPSAINLQKCHGPGNGCCALCGAPEDAIHILF